MSAKNFQCNNVIENSSTESRHALISWINASLNLNYAKVEELCSGVAYCMLMDLLFPGCLSLNRIKYDAKLEYEYQSNFKLFQNALGTVGCSKNVPIGRLVMGKFQENLEFLQWFKKFFDANHGLLSEADVTPMSGAKSTGSSGGSSVKKSKPTSRPVQIVHPIVPQGSRNKSGSVASLEKKLSDMVEKRDLYLQERQYYFRKLRAIEILCNSKQQQAETDSEDVVPDSVKELVSKIFEKMYETADGFAPED